MNTKRTRAGFSLMELMIALTVASILLGLAVPNLTQFMKNNKLTSGANDFMSSLQRARTESVKRQANVVVCETADPTAANPVCGAGQAWIVFQDTNGNWVSNGVATEPVIERHPALDSTVTIKFDGSAGYPIVAFNPTGFASPTGPVTPTRNVVICDSRGTAYARAVLISPTGRARASSVAADVTAAVAQVTGGSCP